MHDANRKRIDARNGGKWFVSTGGGVTPVWSPSGRELFYMRGQALMSVAVDAVGEALRADPPVQLFTGPDNHEDGRAIVSLTLVITYSSTVPRRSAFELIARRAGTLWQRRPAALT